MWGEIKIAKRVIQEEFEVIKNGYFTIMMKVKGHEPESIFRSDPYTDCLFRAPFLATALSQPEEILFAPGSIIKITIELLPPSYGVGENKKPKEVAKADVKR